MSGNNLQITGNGITTPYQYQLLQPLQQLNENTNPPELLIQNGFANGNSVNNSFAVKLENPFPNQILMVNVSGCMRVDLTNGEELITPLKWLSTPNPHNQNGIIVITGFIPNNAPIVDNASYIFDVQFSCIGY